MSSINAKLGLKPKTKVRAATHAPQLASRLHCLACGCRHVLATISENGKRMGTHFCGSCGRFWVAA